MATTTTRARMVSALELSAQLGISRSSVYRLVEDGEIPHYRVGGQLRFDVDQVLDALREEPA